MNKHCIFHIISSTFIQNQTDFSDIIDEFENQLNCTKQKKKHKEKIFYMPILEAANKYYTLRILYAQHSTDIFVENEK